MFENDSLATAFVTATIQFDSIYIPLAAALGLSLTIERILEFSNNILERVIGKRKGKKLPRDTEYEKAIERLEDAYKRDRLTREIEKQLKEQRKDREKLKKELLKERAKAKPDSAKIKELKMQILELEQDVEFDEEFSSATVLVEPAKDPDDGKKMKKLMMQLIGFAAGIIAARYSGIRLFSSFLTELGQPPLFESVDYLLTGLLIGGGSGPMHVLIQFITQRKITTGQIVSAETKEKTKENNQPESPVLVENPALISTNDWNEIPYYGGVDRDILEFVHVRESNPDCIVYHHTGMPANSTFDDVVRVIKNKTDSNGNSFLTGYNCVVLADGSIHPFCRWDRYGNHTAGHNTRSLGIAMNGNFETDPKIPGANSDGKMGHWRPTEIQLKSAARVVTLWSFLYDIPLDFKKSILPHNLLSSNACPGSSFPYTEFQKWIEFFAKKWQQSNFIQEQIEAYKLKPYLFVENRKEV